MQIHNCWHDGVESTLSDGAVNVSSQCNIDLAFDRACLALHLFVGLEINFKLILKDYIDLWNVFAENLLLTKLC